ncbi:MAG: insulinase family protein [Bacteroidia bacterium]|nr:insulinase family protein [Bacteroidia bacterium]
MKLKLIVSVGLLFSLLTAPQITFSQGPKFVEEVKKTGNEIVITYKKYVLPNGLSILVHEDHSDPVAYVDVTYHVGSAREQEGRSGFAHFFEHMMFQGSKNVADEQHFKVITEAGGTLNGSTNSDRTNYFETVPSNQVEKMLWLEADRMGFLLDSVTQKKFEVQRATVKNERGQNYDNRPYGLMGEKIGEALYPQGHPYSWTTIGYIEDLNRVDVNDLKRFYMRWYGPNNAVLTVAGDVNTEEIIKLADKYFGSIPRGPEVKPQQITKVSLAENRYIHYEDNVKFPMVRWSFPTVAARTEDDAALTVLGQILSGSKSSPMYEAFIKSKKAVSANCYQYSRELAGQFEFGIRANAGTALAEMEKELKSTLEKWEKTGATDEDIEKFKASFQSSLYDGLATVQGKGAQLAAYYTYTGDGNYLKKEIAAYLKVTKADVMRVYNTYIKGKNAVVLSCVPKGKAELKAHDETWKMYTRNIQQESSEYKNLSYTEPKDVFDRSKMPNAKPASLVPVPDYWTDKLTNGINLIGVSNNEIPKVNILISFKAGHRYEPKEKAGISSMLSSLMEESTTQHSAEDIEAMLDKLGSSVSVGSGSEEFSISISCLKSNLDATLKIAEEIIFSPKFDTEDYELVKKDQLDGLAQQQTSAANIASNIYAKLVYGPNHIMGINGDGTPETVNAISLDDIKKFYAGLSSNETSIAISGDVKKDEVMSKLGFMNKLKPNTLNIIKQPDAPAISKTKVYFADKKGAPQSEIRIGYMTNIAYDATGDYFKNSIMNFAFAGAFNSRINFLLREVRGFTYGTRGGFSGGNKVAGPYTISGGFRANSTDSSIVDLMTELKKYADAGVTDDELTFAKNAMAQSDALKYESPFQKLGFVKRILDYNLPKDFVKQQGDILNTITKAEINERAKKHLPYNNMVILIVGDKASNFDKVKALGYDITELDLNGNEIKANAPVTK